LPKVRIDQAEGLRRMLDQGGLRVVSVSTGDSGGPGAIVNLAGALAELGRDVLILDGRPSARGVTSALGLKAPPDPYDASSGRELEDMIVRGPAGIRVLSLVDSARAPAPLTERDQLRLMQRLGNLGIPVDTLLVDAAPGRASALFSPCAGVREVIVLAGGNAQAITAGYALIKRLSNEFACHEFHVLVNNVASESSARTIVRNMADVARRYLRVSIDFMGHVPPDEKLRHAARLRLPVVAAFPAATASVSFRSLAQAITSWPCDGVDTHTFDGVINRAPRLNSLRPVAA